jgi:hypothetical protein
MHSGVVTLKKLAARWTLTAEIEKRCLVRLDAPTSVEMTAWAQPDRNRLLVHLVNYQTAPGRIYAVKRSSRVTEDVLPVYGVRLHVQVQAEDITAAVLQPSGTPLSVVAGTEDDPSATRIYSGRRAQLHWAQGSRDIRGESVIEIPLVDTHDIVEITLRAGICPKYPDSDRVLPFDRHDLRAKAQEYVTANPPVYDPDDDGVVRWEEWEEK